MNKDFTKNITEYTSLLLVLSFIFFHNISFVIFGLILAIYTININYFQRLINFEINKKEYNDKISKSTISEESNNDIYNEKPRLSLVDAVEEFGFIPSQHNNNDSDVA